MASILLQTADILAATPAMAGYCLVDEQLLDLSEVGLAVIAGRTLNEEEAARARIAADLAGRLRQRNLFVRCFSFSKTMPLDPYSADAAQRTGLERLQREAANHVERAKLVGKIGREVTTILDLTSNRELLEALPGDNILPYIWVSPPEPPKPTSTIPRAY